MPKHTKADLRKRSTDQLRTQIQKLDEKVQELRAEAGEIHAVLDEKLREQRDEALAAATDDDAQIGGEQ